MIHSASKRLPYLPSVQLTPCSLIRVALSILDWYLYTHSRSLLSLSLSLDSRLFQVYIFLCLSFFLLVWFCCFLTRVSIDRLSKPNSISVFNFSILLYLLSVCAFLMTFFLQRLNDGKWGGLWERSVFRLRWLRFWIWKRQCRYWSQYRLEFRPPPQNQPLSPF